MAQEERTPEMVDTALMLAHRHIGDLLAEADRERRANLVRSRAARTSRTAGAWAPASQPVRWIARVLLGMPRATAR
jgi:hypothetical protein